MDYVQQSDLTGMIPPKFLTEALDDDGDGDAGKIAAAWAGVLARVTSRIDSLLGRRFALPFPDPLSAVVTDAAKVFACEILYQRRGYAPENNPWTAEGKRKEQDLRDTVKSIPTLPLDPNINRAKPSVVIDGSPSVITTRSGRSLV